MLTNKDDIKDLVFEDFLKTAKKRTYGEFKSNWKTYQDSANYSLDIRMKNAYEKKVKEVEKKIYDKKEIISKEKEKVNELINIYNKSVQKYNEKYEKFKKIISNDIKKGIHPDPNIRTKIGLLQNEVRALYNTLEDNKNSYETDLGNLTANIKEIKKLFEQKTRYLNILKKINDLPENNTVTIYWIRSGISCNYIANLLKDSYSFKKLTNDISSLFKKDDYELSSLGIEHINKSSISIKSISKYR